MSWLDERDGYIGRMADGYGACRPIRRRTHEWDEDEQLDELLPRARRPWPAGPPPRPTEYLAPAEVDRVARQVAPLMVAMVMVDILTHPEGVKAATDGLALLLYRRGGQLVDVRPMVPERLL